MIAGDLRDGATVVIIVVVLVGIEAGAASLGGVSAPGDVADHCAVSAAPASIPTRTTTMMTTVAPSRRSPAIINSGWPGYTMNSTANWSPRTAL